MNPTEIRLIDGKTEFKFRTKEGGMWPPLEGSVRPASNREISTLDARLADIRVKAGAGSEAAMISEKAKFFASRLTSWNVSVSITPENVENLPWEIFRQLDDVVVGAAWLVLGNSDATSPS